MKLPSTCLERKPANVMKTFEQDNNKIGNQRVWMRSFIF